MRYNYLNQNSMRELNFEQMEEVQGGGIFGRNDGVLQCAASLAVFSWVVVAATVATAGVGGVIVSGGLMLWCMGSLVYD